MIDLQNITFLKSELFEIEIKKHYNMLYKHLGFSGLIKEGQNSIISTLEIGSVFHPQLFIPLSVVVHLKESPERILQSQNKLLTFGVSNVI